MDIVDFKKYKLNKLPHILEMDGSLLLLYHV